MVHVCLANKETESTWNLNQIAAVSFILLASSWYLIRLVYKFKDHRNQAPIPVPIPSPTMPPVFHRSSHATLPALFLSHGPPTFITDTAHPAHRFLRRYALESAGIADQRIRAIVVISSHFYSSSPTHTPRVGGARHPTALHDFSSMPQENMLTERYPCKGSPEIAEHIRSLLQEAGFVKAYVDDSVGIDHGAWVPLKLMYPDADVPIVEVGIMPDQDLNSHFRMGMALSTLRKERILVIGSGNLVHNLDESHHLGEPIKSWAVDFYDEVRRIVTHSTHSDTLCSELQRLWDKHPARKKCHPKPHHFLPLATVCGAASGNGKEDVMLGKILHESWSGCMPMSYISLKNTNDDKK